jgi:signal peptidase I
VINFLKSVGLFFLDLIQVIVLGLSFFVIIYLVAFQPHQVKGLSMYPNFDDKDLLLTDKLSYRFGKPKRGDIIIFKAPAGEACADIDCEYIKRIIGLPGETVKVVSGKVFVNGSLLEEKYLPTGLVTNNGSFLREGVEEKVPEGEYLPMGDNRPHSRDGRDFGTIPYQSIVGKAMLRYWPLTSLSYFRTVKYNY